MTDNKYHLNLLSTNSLSQDAQVRWCEMLSPMQVLIGRVPRIVRKE